MARIENRSQSPEANPQSKEIEKKFVVSKLPENLSEFPRTTIKQGYLAIDDESEVRIRQKGQEHFLTIKAGAGLVRTEQEVLLSVDQFTALWSQTEGKRVAKDRYTIPHGDSVIELDIYKDKLAGLAIAEVEFQNIAESKKFVPPIWLGGEVTEDSSYKNQQLAKRSKLPPDLQQKMSMSAEGGIVAEQSLKEGVKQLIAMIETKREAKGDEPTFVMVSGRTSSGKTSAVTSEILKKFGNDASVLSMDDYSKGNSFIKQMTEQGQTINWDHPLYMDFDLIKQHLTQLKQGELIQKPIFSFKTGEREGTEPFSPKGVVIVEGLFALRDELKDKADVKAFVDISLHGSIVRRLLRDVQRTNMEPSQILGYYLSTVEPMYQEHIVGTKENADIVLQNEYNPANEAGRSGLYEVQAKFKAENIESKLQRAGAELIGQVSQEDYFLQPTDTGSPDSDELIRIRKQGDKTTLAYKGPRVGSDIRIRPKIEFEIDDEIEGTLLEKYGNRMKEVIKIRDLYQLKGVIASVDTVIAKKGDEIEPTGKFFELRTTNKENGDEQIKNACDLLGIDYEERINASYLELNTGKKEYTVFPEIEREHSPLALYEKIYDTIPSERNEVYFSSPLTSGGAKRLFENKAGSFADAIPTIIKLNGKFSETIAQESQDLLIAYKFTLPHHIGSREGWGEVDYMKFWMFYLSGISKNGAKQFDQQLGQKNSDINTNIFNDYSLPRDVRAREYDKLVDSFVDFIQNTEAPINPVDSMVSLPDHKLSLGCSSEMRLAKALHIPTQEVDFDKNHPGFKKRITQVASWLTEESTSQEAISNPSNYVVIFKPV